MTPRSISDLVVRQPPVLVENATLGAAVEQILESGLPALPVVDRHGRFTGIFGEREVMAAVFPGYVQQLRHAGFLSRSLDEALEMREAARQEPVRSHVNREHVDVGPDFSDTQVAEIFLHHAVLVVPILEHRRPVGLIQRVDFFRAIAERFLGAADG